MRLIDEIYTRWPFYGSRKIVQALKQDSHKINRKRVQRLMRIMGIEAIYPKPNLSLRAKEHRVFPYLLRDVKITHIDQVWSTDITYIPMASGFMYLVAIIDWYSRYILSWQLSNTLDVHFCLDALDMALGKTQPEIFNTDQGPQFTSQSFLRKLENEKIQISMDGKGRALDNIYIERFWRSLKYENIYLQDYQTVQDLQKGLAAYIEFYNKERIHQALSYKTPAMIYYMKNGEISYSCLRAKDMLHCGQCKDYPAACQKTARS